MYKKSLVIDMHIESTIKTQLTSQKPSFLHKKINLKTSSNNQITKLLL